MTPQHDPLDSYFASLEGAQLSVEAEEKLYRSLHHRRTAHPLLLWSVPPAVAAAAYAFLMWCAATGPSDVPEVGHPLLKQQMTSAGLLPESKPVNTSSLPGRGV